jgi:hypothetical protein
MNAIAVCLLVLLSLGAAQPVPDGPPPQAPGPAADAAADEFAPLARAFRNLYQSLQAKGGVAAEDHDVIRAVATRGGWRWSCSCHSGSTTGRGSTSSLPAWLRLRAT